MGSWRVADFFCGAGGWSEGFRAAGFEVVFALDYWGPARRTHKLNHPNAAHPGLDCFEESAGDIGWITFDNIEEVVPKTEVIVGSPPCVSFSTSNRAGGADKSLGIALIEQYLRIVAYMKHRKGSVLEFWLMENVPRSMDHIKDAYTFEDLGFDRETMKRMKKGLKMSDVALAIRKGSEFVFNAADYGVPQRRKRYITGEYPWPTQTGDEVSLGTVIEALRSRSEKIRDPVYGFHLERDQVTDHFYTQHIPTRHWRDAQIKKEQGRFYGRMSFPEDLTKPARTITATRSTMTREAFILEADDGGYRLPTIREVASIMSFPITYQFAASSEAAKYRLVGNAVCPRLSHSFATSIAREAGLPRRRGFKTKTKSPPVAFDADNPPRPLEHRLRHNLTTFAEIVPDIRFDNFRVEVTNGRPKENGGVIEWSARLHHGTGNGNMRSWTPDISVIEQVFDNAKRGADLKLFTTILDEYLLPHIPEDPVLFQQLHTGHADHVARSFFTPREALGKLSAFILSSGHPADARIPITRFPEGGRIIKFEGGSIPYDSVPLHHLLAAYGAKLLSDWVNGVVESSAVIQRTKARRRS